jgi:hypothetical protein
MRPGQNKRMRGRNNNNNNNRRGPNPLTRSYESNGPDVKIRGNPHHIAEKYLQLARDAHTSGDPVAAENYLQHAEHYFRIIATAQAAQLQAQSGYQRPPGEAEQDDGDDDDDIGGLSDRFASPSERAAYLGQTNAPNLPQGQPQQTQPQPPQPAQPFAERPPYENDRQPQGDRNFQGRPDRNNNDRNNNNNNNRQDRGPRQERPFGERPFQDRPDQRNQRDNRQRDFRQPYRDNVREQPSPAPVVAEAPFAPGLPSFITAPPRVVTASEAENAPAIISADQTAPPLPETANDEQPFAPRGRRRRPRANFGYDAPANEPAGEDAPTEAGETPAGE